MPKKKTTMVPVTERAIVQRINRRLEKDGERLLKCRESSRGYESLGDFYRVDINRNAVIDTHVDLQTLATELDLLGIAEQVE